MSKHAQTATAVAITLLLTIITAVVLWQAMPPPPAITADDPTSFTNMTVTGDLTVEGTTTMQAMTYTEAVWTGVSTFTDTVAANAGLSVDSPAFTVANTSGNVRTGGTLEVEGATTLTGTVTTVGAATIGGASTLTGAATASASLTTPKLAIAASESLSPTNGTMITPTKSFVQVTTAAASGHTLGQCPSAGMLLVLENTINAALVITDTGTAVLAGDQTLGQYDTISLICASAAGSWLQISASNN